jgi:hypothetical protein
MQDPAFAPHHNVQVHRRCTPLALLAARVAFTATTLTAAPVEDLQYEGTVAVGPDGNGWVAARFPTTVGGDSVAYYFDVSSGEGIKALGVTLNGEVVLRTASLSPGERTQVILNLVGTIDNELMVSAEGTRGAIARFAVLAVSDSE